MSTRMKKEGGRRESRGMTFTSWVNFSSAISAIPSGISRTCDDKVWLPGGGLSERPKPWGDSGRGNITKANLERGRREGKERKEKREDERRCGSGNKWAQKRGAVGSLVLSFP